LALIALLLGAGAILLMPRPEKDPTVEPASAGIPTIHDGALTVWAAPAPPYSLAGVDGPFGFDVDLITEVARRMGLEARVVPAHGDPFASLGDRVADVVVAGAPASVELEGRVNLSEPYVRVLQALVVNVDARPDIEGIDDVAQGDELAVVEGSTGHGWAASTLEPDALVIEPYPDAEVAAVALAAGSVDGLVIDESDAMAAVQARPSLRIVETVPTGAGLGIAVDPRNGALLQAVNQALASIAADGTYDRIYERYEAALPPGGRITAA
jgi:polar amino acid transport system substrate-binding protein